MAVSPSSDRHVRWLRRRLARGVAGLAIGWFATGALVAAAAAAIRGERSPEELATIAGIGAGVAFAVFAFAIVVHPRGLVSWRRRRRRGPCRYELASDGAISEVVDRFRELGFHPVVTIAPFGTDRPVFDLFQDPSQTMTAVWRRRSSTIALYSRLRDGRIVVTDPRTAIPNERILVPSVADRFDATVVIAHRHALDGLAYRRCGPVPDDGYVFIQALAVQHEATLGLGPVLGPFLSVEGRTRPLRWKVAVDLDELAALVPGHPASIADLLSTGAS